MAWHICQVWWYETAKQSRALHFPAFFFFLSLEDKSHIPRSSFPPGTSVKSAPKFLAHVKLLGRTKASSHMGDWVGDIWQKQRRGNDSISYQGFRCLLFPCSLNKDEKASDLQLSILSCFISGFKFYFCIKWRTSDCTIVWGFYLPWPECLSMGLSLAGSKLLIELRHTDYRAQWATQCSRAGRAWSQTTSPSSPSCKNHKSNELQKCFWQDILQRTLKKLAWSHLKVNLKIPMLVSAKFCKI